MNEKLTELLKKPWVVPTSVGVASFAAGLGVGYILAKRKYDQYVTYEEDQEEGESQLKMDFDRAAEAIESEQISIREKYISPSESIHRPKKPQFDFENPSVEEPEEEREYVITPKPDPRDIIVDHQPNVVEEEEDVETVNIFDDDDPSWNYEAELSARTPNRPYIIHRDEFFNEEMGFSQSTVTYYEVDDVLTDERDTPIHKHESIVGEINFGHGSGDPNVVYVRNEKLRIEYEILRDVGSYEVEVLGHQVEAEMAEDDLKHSRHPGKFREES